MSGKKMVGDEQQKRQAVGREGGRKGCEWDRCFDRSQPAAQSGAGRNGHTGSDSTEAGRKPDQVTEKTSEARPGAASQTSRIRSGPRP